MNIPNDRLWKPDEETVQRSLNYVKATDPELWQKVIEEEKKMYLIYKQETRLQPQDEFVMQNLGHRIGEENKLLTYAQIARIKSRILKIVRNEIGAVYKEVDSTIRL